MKNEQKIHRIQSSLTYAKEEVECAEESAKGIKDPELTKKISDIKASIVGTKDYLRSKVDSKKG